jgi:SPRY domain-containing SOCS box protein 3
MMFGIGTKKARLHVDAFVNMLGEDEASWGLSHKGLLWHGGRHKQYIKCFKENIATTIGLYFDGVAGTLTYFKDGVCLGVAFTGLNEVAEPLYPIVCSTAAKTEMALGVLKRDFVNLQDRCRATILAQLTHEEQIEQLCLPLRIKQYISEGLENFQEDVALAMNNQMSHW